MLVCVFSLACVCATELLQHTTVAAPGTLATALPTGMMEEWFNFMKEVSPSASDADVQATLQALAEAGVDSVEKVAGLENGDVAGLPGYDTLSFAERGILRSAVAAADWRLNNPTVEKTMAEWKPEAVGWSEEAAK